jgi:hypothetical protein
MAFPHLALYMLIFFYLMIGAWAFRRLEFQAEIAYHQDRLNSIEDVYKQISNTLRQECSNFNEDDLYESLSRLSSFMEGKHFRLSPTSKNDVRAILPSKWDSTSSILYALSILVGRKIYLKIYF